MIHHLSIPARQPLHVAQVLVELFEGSLSAFGPHGDSYIAWMGDDRGSALEVFPEGTEMVPDSGAGQATFRHHPHATGHTATHAAVSVHRSKADILALAAREGWRALELSRGSFRVIEFWIENRVLLELLTPDMTAEYLAATRHRRSAAPLS